MGYLRIEENVCQDKEKDRSLKEQFIILINDKNMMTEIVTQLTAIKTPVEPLVRSY